MWFVCCSGRAHLIKRFSAKTAFVRGSCRCGRHTDIVAQIAHLTYRVRYMCCTCYSCINWIFLAPKTVLLCFFVSQLLTILRFCVVCFGFLTFGTQNSSRIVCGLHICLFFLTFETVELAHIFLVLLVFVTFPVDWIIVWAWLNSSSRTRRPLAFFYIVSVREALYHVATIVAKFFVRI